MGINSAENRIDRQTFDPTEALASQAWETLPLEQKASIAWAVAPGVSISGIVYPSTTEALAAVMQTNDRPLILPCGAGSKLGWGGVVGGKREERREKREERRRKEAGENVIRHPSSVIPHPSEGRGQKEAGKDVIPHPSSLIPHPEGENEPLLVVSTARLNRLIDHAIGDLTVTVEAGMGFADLQATLAIAGQFLPLDPAYPDQATIGGIVATADTGSLRQRYNGVRDLLLGVSIVRADGQIAKAGGRVVKNVAGYDLMKLFTGSYGTLGIITQVTLRVYPLPEASQTVVLSGDAGAIAQAAQTLLNSALTPASADLLSESVAALLDVKGTALAIRFQSSLPSVAEQTKRMMEVSEVLGLAIAAFSGTDDATLWQHLQERMTAAHQADAITCKIGIRPSNAVALLNTIRDPAIDPAIAPPLGQIHAASGLGRLVLDPATPPETLLKTRLFCEAHGGFLSVLQAPIALKQAIDVWGYNGNALHLMRQLKQHFDPHHRFSPHRFVGDI